MNISVAGGSGTIGVPLVRALVEMQDSCRSSMPKGGARRDIEDAVSATVRRRTA
jgi:nucleoside-diphosphate-sugar epimerase